MLKAKFQNTKVTPEVISELLPEEVFVFESNLAGIHGAGAAYAALQWGAETGVGQGLRGQTYALPTKDHNIRTRMIEEIYDSVTEMHVVIRSNPDKHFLITKVGCGLAGLSIESMARLFIGFSDTANISLPQDFLDVLRKV